MYLYFRCLADFTNIQRSGRAHDPGAPSSFWTLVLGSLLFVTVIYIALYAHYEKQWLGFALPTSRFERLINARMTVSRYDNVSMAEGVATISTKPSSTVPSPPSSTEAVNENANSPAATTAFDNPMFNSGSTSGGSEVANNAISDHPIETIGPNRMEKGDDINSIDDGMEFENLVDISLDSTETINIQ